MSTVMLAWSRAGGRLRTPCRPHATDDAKSERGRKHGGRRMRAMDEDEDEDDGGNDTVDAAFVRDDAMDDLRAALSAL